MKKRKQNQTTQDAPINWNAPQSQISLSVSSLSRSTTQTLKKASWMKITQQHTHDSDFLKNIVECFWEWGMWISMCRCKDGWWVAHVSLELEISLTLLFFFMFMWGENWEDQCNHEWWCENIISVFTILFFFVIFRYDYWFLCSCEYWNYSDFILDVWLFWRVLQVQSLALGIRCISFIFHWHF